MPALVNIRKGFHFQHGAHSAVTGITVTSFKQPAVHFLAFITAGRNNIAKRCLMVFIEIPQ
ncbi:Uncharacterised protein [Vibrio cholerae]|nr:Uncharacterised protein [Vibrio cholerae]